jgi:putative flippase GtrA
MAKLRKELNRFLVVGIISVVIDYLFYQLFIQSMSLNKSKTISFIIGTLFSYFANKQYTFSNIDKHSLKTILKFFCLYITTLLVNVGTNLMVLKILINYEQRLSFAFVIATGFSATLNFLGMKLHIFNMEKE